jgi:hypothetical protein
MKLLKVANVERPGDFITVPVPEAMANEGTIKSNVYELLSDPETLGALYADGGYRRILDAIRGHGRALEIQEATAELRRLLESGEVREEKYQDWCEKHSWSFGNAYVARDELRTISAEARVDLLLESLFGYRDIIELKRPNMKVIRRVRAEQENCDEIFCFAKHASEAIGQCHSYLDIFHDDARGGLRHSHRTIAYHPRATVVLGRSSQWSQGEHHALRGLNHRLHGITVLTYDYLLAQCEALCRTISRSVSAQPSG